MAGLVLHILFALAAKEFVDASASEPLKSQHECVHDKVSAVRLGKSNYISWWVVI